MKNPTMGPKRKLKPIMASLRESKRNIGFELLSKRQIKGFEAVNKAILGAITKYLGTLEAAKAGSMLIRNKWNGHAGILRVDAKYVDPVRAALCFVTDIQDIPVTIKTTRVSGMIRKV